MPPRLFSGRYVGRRLQPKPNRRPTIDVRILSLRQYVRSLICEVSSLTLTQYLPALVISDQSIGLFMTLTLLADVAMFLLLTAIASYWKKR
jgi:hypothetical protein